MPLTVFYAWQSDTNPKGNHYLIRDALEDAIKALNADVKVEEAIRLDHDTKGKTGTPHVAKTILDKIGNCTIFVADLTFVGKTWGRIVNGKRRRKRMPNPNVMLEVGYASALVAWDQIIFVMNSAFGGPKYLPFDLKFRRFPIQYDLPSADGQRPDAQQINQRQKELAAVFKKAIGDIIDSGVVSRDSEEAARAAQLQRQARKEEAEKEREAFEQKLLDNTYYDFKSEYAVMAATVIPMVPPKYPVAFDDHLKLRRNFQPPGANGCSSRPLPKSFMLAEVGETTPYNVVELRSDGCLFMVRNLAYGRDGLGNSPFVTAIDPIKLWVMPMNNYQPQFIDAIQQYLAGLVEFGVQGPWFLSLSMLKMKNGILVPHHEWHWITERGQTWFGNHMHADVILIPKNLNLKSKDAVTQVLKQPLKEIWRHNAHNGMPVFDGNDVTWDR
jgi:hypothetical protein